MLAKTLNCEVKVFGARLNDETRRYDISFDCDSFI